MITLALPLGTSGIDSDAPMYHLNPGDIYYNYSVKNHHKMVENQRVPKQLLSALLDNTQAPFPKEIITNQCLRKFNPHRKSK